MYFVKVDSKVYPGQQLCKVDGKLRGGEGVYSEGGYWYAAVFGYLRVGENRENFKIEKIMKKNNH